jgi:hypothetical protein
MSPMVTYHQFKFYIGKKLLKKESIVFAPDKARMAQTQKDLSFVKVKSVDMKPLVE